ncbi:hypothetical protein C817_00736 [Dorea sp. 5-2]|nr:hypothetical protein C817_00736 [Dorea sp. 5-2]
MTDIETKIREMIIEKYGSLKKFCEIIEMPWSTLDSILKRGIANSNITNVMKITKELGVDTENLASGIIINRSTKNMNAEGNPNIIAQNDSERRLLMLYRKVGGASEDEKEAIINQFESTIDVYLKAKGMSPIEFLI